MFERPMHLWLGENTGKDAGFRHQAERVAVTGDQARNK